MKPTTESHLRVSKLESLRNAALSNANRWLKIAADYKQQIKDEKSQNKRSRRGDQPQAAIQC